MELVNFQEDFQVNDLSTDEALDRLCKYGEPRLSKHGAGWHCALDVFVTGEGVDFKVRTGFDEPTPNVAVRTCLGLLILAIKKLKKG